MSEDIDTYNQILENNKIKARRDALKEKMDELSSFRKRKPLSDSNVDSSTNFPGDKKRQFISSNEECPSFEENPHNAKVHQNKTESIDMETSGKDDVFTSINQKENNAEISAKSPNKALNFRGKSRFAALAATINQWESEDIQTLPSYKNKFISDVNSGTDSNKNDLQNSPVKIISKFKSKTEIDVKQEENLSLHAVKVPPTDDNEARNSTKPVVTASILKDQTDVNVKNKVSIWDKAVVATLEAQGFTKSPSASKITYQYPNANINNKTHQSNNVVKSNISSQPVKKVTAPTTTAEKQLSVESKIETDVSVSDRISMFSKPKKRKSDVDPATMSLSARVALFEKAMDKPEEPSTPSILFKRSLSTDVPEKNKAVRQSSLPVCHSPKKVNDISSNYQMSPSKTSASQLTKDVHQSLMNQISADKWQSNDIASKFKAEREQELADLRNRWEKKSKKHLIPEKLDSESDPHEDHVEDGGIPEVEADIPEEEDNLPEEEDNLYDKEHDNIQLREDYENEELQYSHFDSITEEDEEYTGDVDDDVAEACGEIDKMLDEAMEDDVCEEKVNENEIIPKPGHLYPSLDCLKLPPPVSPPPPPPPSNLVDKGTELPLMHTISFYRRQTDANKTPVKKLIRRDVCSPPSPSEELNKKQASILQKIKVLQEDINAQQTIISQTSQALNLCRATSEFYGSSEQIEGERLLLIASQKRQACLDEITGLKTEGAMMDVKHKTNYNESEGVLTLSDIRLPLKRAFIIAIAEGKHDNFVHNFLCLIRHGPQVIATEMISTQQGTLSSGSLSFSNMITIHNLESEFNVIFEVYGLQCPKESLSHDRKYHIKKESSKLKLTPKKKQDMKKIVPAISSPGGPLAIRTSSFAIIGYTKLCLKNLSRHVFVLEKVPTTSPLEGNVYMKVKCHADLRADQRGFMTMFEDVSGFGAWHRRWCVLTGQHLAYWKYPNDEKKKEPIGFIDLRRCITRNVTSAPREICARLHTLMMVTMRPLSDADEEDLITQKYDTVTTTKHLLSADSKEERMWWCGKINQALTNIRRWDPNALRPVEQSSSKE